MTDHGPVEIKIIRAEGVEVGDRSVSWFEPWANISSIVATRTPEDELTRVTIGIGFRRDRLFIKIDEGSQWANFCAAARDYFPQVASFAELQKMLAEPGMVFLHWDGEETPH